MRKDWKFIYGTQEVAAAAAAKRDHHAVRESWWCDQQNQVLRDVRDKGIEIDESIASLYANSAVMQGARITVKDEYQTKLNECHAKIKLHSGKAREYEGWVQFLSDRDDSIELDCDDYLFFFGK